jgi:phage-related baseplate assembly protein
VFVADADGVDPNLILADMVAAFESAAGRTLQPAQVERLLINLYAYRESLVRNAIQYAGQQNLLAYSIFPMIDYLGQLLGVARLPAQGATSTIQFTLANALSISYTLPAGTLVGTSDGQFAFAIDRSLTIAAGTLSGVASATATIAGAGANGYLPGQIAVQLKSECFDRERRKRFDQRRWVGT